MTCALMVDWLLIALMGAIVIGLVVVFLYRVQRGIYDGDE